MPHQLAKRVAVAAIGIPTAIGAIYVGGWLLVALLAGLGVLGARELCGLAAARQIFPPRALSYGGAALFPVLTYLLLPAGGGWELRSAVLAVAFWVMAVTAFSTFARPLDRGSLRGASVSLMAGIYAGGLPALLLYLRYPQGELDSLQSTALAVFPLVLTWVCDTLAMAGGVWLNGPKLAPRLSPGKTWSGTITGALAAILASWAYGRWMLEPLGTQLSAMELWGCGLVVGVLGQLGDLAESAWKREAGVKDSGALFPGHGGVLDRLDSLYWNLPGVTLVLVLGGSI